MRCPICKRGVPARHLNQAFPFCGERCRLIDLGNWLGESYRVPLEEEDDDVEGASPDEESGAPRQR